jgi:hypothetical protein
MIMLLVVAFVLVGAVAVLAYRLATFALPFMLALEAARFAYATGAGWIGAAIVGFFAGVGASASSLSCSPRCARRSCASPLR